MREYGEGLPVVSSLRWEFESLRRDLELQRQTVMVAIVCSQLTALSIVLIISLAMRS